MEHLRSRGVHTIATTLFRLESYAYTHEGVENASVEFDLKTLRPTYRLSIGIQARATPLQYPRLGLSEDIIEQAQQLLSSEHLQVEDMIGEMETNRRQAERDRAAAENLRREQEELRATYERKLQELEAKRTELLDQARADAQRLLEEAQSEINAILGQVRRMGREELETNVKEYREEIASRREALSKQRKERPKAQGPANLKPGEEVRIKSLRQNGFVLEPPTAGGDVLIQAGIMKITVKVDDLERIEAREAKPQVRRGGGTGGPVQESYYSQ